MLNPQASLRIKVWGELTIIIASTGFHERRKLLGKEYSSMGWRGTDRISYPVLPLVRQLVEATPPEIAKYIHFGATTQDIMDDASILQIRQGLEIVKRELKTLIEVVRQLATKHRDT